MNTYTPKKTPRAALGIAAAAMAAITMAMMVVLPAGLEAAAPANEPLTLASIVISDAYAARPIAGAEQMKQEVEAERAALAMPGGCLHAAERDTHGS